jgi:hypothetical protein
VRHTGLRDVEANYGAPRGAESGGSWPAEQVWGRGVSGGRRQRRARQRGGGAGRAQVLSLVPVAVLVGVGFDVGVVGHLYGLVEEIALGGGWFAGGGWRHEDVEVGTVVGAGADRGAVVEHDAGVLAGSDRQPGREYRNRFARRALAGGARALSAHSVVGHVARHEQAHHARTADPPANDDAVDRSGGGALREDVVDPGTAIDACALAVSDRIERAVEVAPDGHGGLRRGG